MKCNKYNDKWKLAAIDTLVVTCVKNLGTATLWAENLIQNQPNMKQKCQ
jgi:hypothetical protein